MVRSMSISSRFLVRDCAPSVTVSATVSPAGHWRCRRSDASARTVTPRFTVPTARQERCCTDRETKTRSPRLGSGSGQGRAMKLRFGLLLASAIGLSGTGTAALAADAQLVTKAPVVVPEVWWLHGYFEVGGRDFLNNPCRNCSVTSGQGSLAKYYEYSSIKPGPFLDGHVATGSSNGLYQADVWARNAGYSDQQYLVDLSKAGEHYLTFGWDQTPHLYSTSALTLYNGVGTNALTLPGGLSNSLFVASGNTNPITTPNAAKVKALIDANVHQTDIGIRRDRAAGEYRYTPHESGAIRGAHRK